MAAWLRIGVTTVGVLVGQQPPVGQAGKPGAILPVGMQVGDLVILLDLEGRHLLQECSASGSVSTGKARRGRYSRPGFLRGAQEFLT